MPGRVRSRLTFANVVSLLALFVALGGGAYALTIPKNSVGVKQIKKNAVTSAKIRTAAVRSPDLADGVVTGAKIAAGAVGAAQLTGSERSEGFIFNGAGQVALPVATDTPVAAIELPAGGSYLLTGSTTLGNGAGVENSITCTLRNAGSTITTGNALLAPVAVFSETVTLTGASGGGEASLSCRPENVAAVARSRAIAAVRVGTLPAP